MSRIEFRPIVWEEVLSKSERISMYRLFIADDHAVIRHGIRRGDGYGDRRRSQHDESTPPSSETAMQVLKRKDFRWSCIQHFPHRDSSAAASRTDVYRD